MKKICVLICLFSLILPSFANNTDIIANDIVQQVQNDNTYLGINFEKIPNNDGGKQLIKNNKSFLIINIVVNGKIKPKNEK